MRREEVVVKLRRRLMQLSVSRRLTVTLNRVAVLLISAVDSRVCGVVKSGASGGRGQ